MVLKKIKWSFYKDCAIPLSRDNRDVYAGTIRSISPILGDTLLVQCIESYNPSNLFVRARLV